MKHHQLSNARCISSVLLWTIFMLCPSLGHSAIAPRIVSTVSDGAMLRLIWTGDSPAYRVERTFDLTPVLWVPALSTTLTNANFPLSGTAVFYRVVAIPSVDASEVSDARRSQILDAISEKIALLSGDEIDADNRELLRFMAQFPEFDGMGIAIDGVSIAARFRDGRLYTIINNREDPGPQAYQPGGNELAGIRLPLLEAMAVPTDAIKDRRQPSRALAVTSPVTAAPGIPVSRRVVLFKATLPGIKSPVLDYLVPAFANRGYDVRSGEATLPALLNVQNYGNDIGVFYIDSHGGHMPARWEYEDPVNKVTVVEEFEVFYVMTSTIKTPENETLYSSSLEAQELGYASFGSLVLKGLRRENEPGPIEPPKPVEPKPKEPVYYCVSAAFVKRHWSFSKNSLVYIDTCLSANPLSDPMWNRSFDKGAATYLGWTKSVHDTTAFRTTLALFDDLLGGSQIFPASPRQRPFNFSDIRTFLHRAGLDYDHNPKLAAVLTSKTGPTANGQFALLAPSIQSMRTDESKGELLITGLFDTNAPTLVTLSLDGSIKELPVMGVNANGVLVCSLPAADSLAFGNVTVVQHGHRSNTVPLSAWRVRGLLARHFGPGAPQPAATYEFKLFLRADVHSFRRAPHEIPVFIGSGGQAGVGSTCRFVEASGVAFPDVESPLNSVKWISTKEQPINLPLVYTIPKPSDSDWFRGSVGFNPLNSVYVSVEANAQDAVTVTETVVDPVQGPIEIRYLFSPDTRVYSPTFSNGSWDRASFMIQAGQGPTRGENGIVRWENSPALNPPSQDIPGYAE